LIITFMFCLFRPQISAAWWMPGMHGAHAVLQQYHCFTLNWHTPLLYVVVLVTLLQAKSSVSVGKTNPLRQAVSILC